MEIIRPVACNKRLLDISRLPQDFTNFKYLCFLPGSNLPVNIFAYPVYHRYFDSVKLDLFPEKILAGGPGFFINAGSQFFPDLSYYVISVHCF